MYRYHVDHAVTYTPDDIVLFRDAPFAAWMERLTLENPDHGIPADLDSTESHDGTERQDDMVATLRAEGRHVIQIDLDLDEPDRRTASLAAMRAGADFIVNGQLAVGNLSGRLNLLMRTSGYSDLGDFLYIPCATRSLNTFQSAFRLCFFADLLHTLQGQLPPQLLIIRDAAEVVPLQTEDHIYFYRAVLQRFRLAMTGFRKHRMPDPAESAHFGRWSDCASEVLKQRALGEERRAEEEHEEEQETAAISEEIDLPQLRVASGAGHTLAEQALLLTPDRYLHGKAPGHTPNLARFGGSRISTVPASRGGEHNRRSTDATLQNLEFIGSAVAGAPVGVGAASGWYDVPKSAPAPTLREAVKPDNVLPPQDSEYSAAGLPELEPRPPVFLPPDQKMVVGAPPERMKRIPLDSDSVAKTAKSVIDMDSAPPPSLAPVVQRAETELARIGLKDSLFRRHEPSRQNHHADEEGPAVVAFSSSLITDQELEDR